MTKESQQDRFSANLAELNRDIQTHKSKRESLGPERFAFLGHLPFRKRGRLDDKISREEARRAQLVVLTTPSLQPTAQIQTRLQTQPEISEPEIAPVAPEQTIAESNLPPLQEAV